MESLKVRLISCPQNTKAATLANCSLIRICTLLDPRTLSFKIPFVDKELAKQELAEQYRLLDNTVPENNAVTSSFGLVCTASKRKSDLELYLDEAVEDSVDPCNGGRQSSRRIPF